MKKAYVAPQLVEHGSIEEITELSQDSNRTDTLAGLPVNGLGSLDGCIEVGGQCVS